MDSVRDSVRESIAILLGFDDQSNCFQQNITLSSMC